MEIAKWMGKEIKIIKNIECRGGESGMKMLSQLLCEVH